MLLIRFAEVELELATQSEVDSFLQEEVGAGPTEQSRPISYPWTVECSTSRSRFYRRPDGAILCTIIHGGGSASASGKRYNSGNAATVQYLSSRYTLVILVKRGSCDKCASRAKGVNMAL